MHTVSATVAFATGASGSSHNEIPASLVRAAVKIKNSNARAAMESRWCKVREKKGANRGRAGRPSA